MERDPAELDRDSLIEELMLIKAKTMDGCVEEVGSQRVLFLTTAQAALVASSANSVQRMLDALGVTRKPSLVIDLMHSSGHTDSFALTEPEFWTSGSMRDTNWTGLSKARAIAPFLAPEDERAVLVRIDAFVSDVLLPLALRTNAIVLLNASKGECMLSEAFLRVVQRSRWNGQLPFSVIGMTNETMEMYRNTDPTAHWRKLRSGCQAWQRCDARLSRATQAAAECAAGMPHEIWVRHMDIDAHVPCLILCDTLAAKEDRFDRSGYQQLVAALPRFLGAQVPTLAVKSGYNILEKSIDSGSLHGLGHMAKHVQSGNQLLCLDVRRRAVLRSGGTNGVATREALIAAAKSQLEAWSDELIAKNGAGELLVSCSIAFMHEALFGDGISRTAGIDEAGGVRGAHARQSVPLHAAIARAAASGRRRGRGASSSHSCLAKGGAEKLPPATPEQVREAAQWLAESQLRSYWRAEHTPEEDAARAACGETFDAVHGERIRTVGTFMHDLLSSPQFHHLNLLESSTDVARNLVEDLARIDRLPAETRLEGLQLLRSAWVDFDKATFLADRYKTACKSLFLLQLLLGWVLVVGAAHSPEGSADAGAEPPLRLVQGDAESLGTGVFVVSLLVTALLSFEAIISAKARWRQLRGGAVALESTLWCYRTRVGAFALDEAQHQQSMHAEQALSHTLVTWRDSLMAGTAIATSNFQSRQFEPSVFRHQQFEGGVVGADDHHSPVPAEQYIELRVKPMLSFFEQRIPRYTRQLTALRVALVVLGVIASVLAQQELLPWVAVVSAAEGAFTAWIEFSDKASKVERYSRTAAGLRNLLEWWESLDQVQRAGRRTVGELVQTSEAIIAAESATWLAAAEKGQQSSGTSADEDAAPSDVSTPRPTWRHPAKAKASTPRAPGQPASRGGLRGGELTTPSSKSRLLMV